MAIRRPVDQHKFSPDQMASDSFDRTFRQYAVEVLGYDGTNLQRIRTDESGVLQTTDKNYAYKVTEDGDVTYVAIGAVGSAQASDVWQAMKIDQTTGAVITWADGDSDFDNVATDLSVLSYS